MAKPADTKATRLKRENAQLKTENADLRRQLEALEKRQHVLIDAGGQKFPAHLPAPRDGGDWVEIPLDLGIRYRASLEGAFNETKNPVYVWEALHLALGSGALPAWVAAYFYRVSSRLREMY